jgi:hypothetical protein
VVIRENVSVNAVVKADDHHVVVAAFREGGGLELVISMPVIGSNLELDPNPAATKSRPKTEAHGLRTLRKGNRD